MSYVRWQLRFPQKQLLNSLFPQHSLKVKVDLPGTFLFTPAVSFLLATLLQIQDGEIFWCSVIKFPNQDKSIETTVYSPLNVRVRSFFLSFQKKKNLSSFIFTSVIISSCNLKRDNCFVMIIFYLLFIC